MRHLVVLLLLALGLTACGGSADTTGGGAAPTSDIAPSTTTDVTDQLDGTSWVLDDDREEPRPTLTFDGASIAGTDGCNTYGASLVFDGATPVAEALVGVETIRSTRKACEGHAFADFLPTLGAVRSATLTDDGLLLSGTEGDLRFVES